MLILSKPETIQLYQFYVILLPPDSPFNILSSGHTRKSTNTARNLIELSLLWVVTYAHIVQGRHSSSHCLVESGYSSCQPVLRIRITLMRIRILPFTLMRIRIRVHIKVMRNQILQLTFSRFGPCNAPIWLSKAFTFSDTALTFF